MNNICLPWNQYRETMGSYGLVSGYGMMGPNITYKSFPNQMTYLKLDNQFKWPLISAITVDGQGTLCSVSNFPWWLIGGGFLISLHSLLNFKGWLWWPSMAVSHGTGSTDRNPHPGLQWRTPLRNKRLPIVVYAGFVLHRLDSIHNS